MSIQGKSVLWFLAGCLVFTNALIGTIGGTNENFWAGWLLIAGILSLGIVLMTLLYIFRVNPSFLIAEKEHVLSLAKIDLLRKIQSEAEINNPVLFRQLILSLSPENINEIEFAGVDEASTDEDDIVNYELVDEEEKEIEEQDNLSFEDALNELLKGDS